MDRCESAWASLTQVLSLMVNSLTKCFHTFSLKLWKSCDDTDEDDELQKEAVTWPRPVLDLRS